MIAKGFDKLYLGFIFIMLSFRIQGIDILPDIIGYILFAYGLSCLSAYSYFFDKACKYNYPMIFLSIFSIYQKPVTGVQPGLHMGSLGFFSLILAVAAFVLNLLIVYNLFMGIKDMATNTEKPDIAREAMEKWNYYKYLMFAIILTFVMIIIPALALAYVIVLLIVSISVLIAILGFIKKCKENLTDLEDK